MLEIVAISELKSMFVILTELEDVGGVVGVVGIVGHNLVWLLQLTSDSFRQSWFGRSCHHQLGCFFRWVFE